MDNAGDNMPELVEVQRLGTLAEQLAAVQGNATRVAEILTSIRLSTTEEILDRWRPELQVASDNLVEAARLLHEVRTGLRAPGWQKPERSRSLLVALSEVGRALVELVARTECMQTEIKARDLVVRMRGSTLSRLPVTERAPLERAARLLLAKTEPADG